MAQVEHIWLRNIGYQDAWHADTRIKFLNMAGLPDHLAMALRNGGGKTSLIALHFSLLLPGDRNFIGRTDGRKLADYIPRGGAGLMVTQWRMDSPHEALNGQAPVRRILGALYQHTHAGELKPLYFSVLVTPNSTLDTLPFTVQDEGRARMVTAQELREALNALNSLSIGEPTARYFESQGAWTKHLYQELGFNERLLRLQVRMNQREGSADTQFRFKSDDDFLNFLFTHTLTASAIEALEASLESKRKDVLALNTIDYPTLQYAEDTLESLAVIANIKDEREALNQELSGAVARARGLHEYLRHEEQVALNEAAELQRHKESLRLALGARRNNRAKATWLAAAARHKEARFHLDAAESASDEATKELERAAHGRGVHRLAVRLARLHRARRRLADVLERIQEYTQTAEVKDAEKRRDEAAKELVAATVFDADLQHKHEQSAISALAEAVQGEQEADQRRIALREKGAALRTSLGEAQGTIRRIQQHQERLVRQGDLVAAEEPKAARDRTQAALKEQREERSRLARELEAAQEAEKAAQAEQRQILEEALLAQQGAEHAQRDLTAASDATEAIKANRTIQEVVMGEWDHDSGLDTVGKLLDGAVHDAAREVNDLRIARAEANARYAGLEQYRLTPASPSARRALAALKEAGVHGARSGAHYIAERTDQDALEAARERVRRAPLAASGVVVPPHAIEAAKAALKEIEDQFDEPLALVAPTDLDADLDQPGILFGPGSLERYHFEAAKRAEEAASEKLAQVGAELEAAEGKHEGLRKARDAYRTYREQYPPGSIPALTRARDEAERNAQRAAERRDRAEATWRDHRNLIAELQSRINATQQTLTILGERHQRLHAFCNDHLPQLHEAQRAAENATTALEELPAEIEASTQAHEAAVTARRAAEQAKQEASAMHDKRRGELVNLKMRYQLERPAPKQGDLDYLTRKLKEAESDYQGLTNQPELEAQRKAAEEELESAERHLELASHEARREEAQACLDTLGSLEEASVDAALREAEDRHDQTQKHLAALKERVGDAKAKYEQQRLELTRLPERTDIDLPTLHDAAAAAAFAADQSAQAADLTITIQALESEIQTAEVDGMAKEQRATELSRHRERLNNLAEMHADIYQAVGPDTVAFDGREHDIAKEIDALRTTLGAAKRQHEELNSRRESAAQTLRGIQSDNDAYKENQMDYRKGLLQYSDAALEEHVGRLTTESLQIKTTCLAKIATAENAARDLLAELSACVTEGYDILKTINYYARLKDSDGADVRLIQILHSEKPDSEAINDRLLQLLRARLNDETKSTGALDLAIDAIRACLEDVRVRVQHPDLSLRRTLSIPELTSKSGGETLTAVLVIFFTLVRASRASKQAAPTTTLWLDNPIGQSSAPHLLDIQHRFAEEMGVQLIYSTAVQDHTALAMLPATVWLKNEQRGVNTSRSYITVEEDNASIQAIRMIRERRQAANPTTA